MKCLIVDDEPLAREGLKNYVSEIDFLILIDVCENPLEASQAMHREKIDLLFLDIQMPKMNGMDFLKSLQNPPIVIITTAFPSYALESFQLDVLDYLLKPITFQRFFKAVNKAKDYHDLLQKSPPPTAEIQQIAHSEKESSFFIKAENKYEKIEITEILWVEGMQNYITIYTTQGKYIALLTMKSVEEKLKSHPFLRVHKSFIVAIPKVEGMEGNELLIQGNRIPVSRNYKEEVMEKIINKRLWKKQ